MTLLVALGFDNYDNWDEFITLEPDWTKIVSGFEEPSVPTTGGRFGGGRLFCESSNATGNARIRGIFTEFLSLQPKTLVVGVSILRTDFSGLSGNSDFIEFLDGSNVHLKLDFDRASNLVRVILLGGVEASFTLTAGVWHRLEVKLTVDSSTGEVTIRLDGAQVFTTTGVNTQQASNAFTDRVNIQAETQVGNNGTLDISFDDITINDDQGSFNNDFLGDLRIETLRPNADTPRVDFTPQGGGDNFVEVDEATGPDEDTTYSSSENIGDIDLYEVATSVVAQSTIIGVVVRSTLKKSDGGVRETRLLANTGTIGVGATNILLTDYTNFNDIFETDPSTDSALFTLANVNSIQIGVEIIT